MVEILAGKPIAQELSNNVYGDLVIIELYAGNKDLDVYIYPSKRKADTYIRNRENETIVPGATTVLYSQASDHIQHFSNENGLALEYTFATRWSSMKAWAKSSEHGVKIFQWDSIETEQDERGELLTAKKLFRPQDM